MDTHFDGFWTGVWGGLLGGLFFNFVASLVLHDKYREKWEHRFGALSQEIELLRNIRWSFEKAKRKVSDEGLLIAKTIASKKHQDRSDQENNVLEFYTQQTIGTGQKLGGIEHAPPDESGAWQFVADDPDGLVWHRNGGQAKSIGRPSSTVALHR